MERILWADVLDGRWRVEDRGWSGAQRWLRLARPAEPRPLTRSERGVLTLVSCGMSNEDIGDLLGCGGTTVATHLASVADKLTARRLDLLAFGPLVERMWEAR